MFLRCKITLGTWKKVSMHCDFEEPNLTGLCRITFEAHLVVACHLQLISLPRHIVFARLCSHIHVVLYSTSCGLVRAKAFGAGSASIPRAHSEQDAIAIHLSWTVS